MFRFRDGLLRTAGLKKKQKQMLFSNFSGVVWTLPLVSIWHRIHLAESDKKNSFLFYHVNLTGFPPRRTQALHNVASYSYFSLHAKIPDELSYSQLIITYQLTITTDENYALRQHQICHVKVLCWVGTVIAMNAKIRLFLS